MFHSFRRLDIGSSISNEIKGQKSSDDKCDCHCAHEYLLSWVHSLLKSNRKFIILNFQESLFSSDKFIDLVSSLSLQPLNDWVVSWLVHLGLSCQDPQIFVVWAWNHWISVVVWISQLDDPILGSNFENRVEDHFQFGVWGILNVGLSDWFNFLSVPVACVVHSDRLAVYQRVHCFGISAIPLKVVRDDSLFVPLADISVGINFVNSFRRINWELRVLDWGKSNKSCGYNGYSSNTYHGFVSRVHLFWTLSENIPCI